MARVTQLDDRMRVSVAPMVPHRAPGFAADLTPSGLLELTHVSDDVARSLCLTPTLARLTLGVVTPFREDVRGRRGHGSIIPCKRRNASCRYASGAVSA